MTKARTNADNVSGDISGVTAGTGLTGGGTSGTLTLDLTTPVATTNGGTGLSSFTTGDIIYSSSGNTLSKLGIGTTSQVLTVASGLPSWATPASSGGMTLISETVASANSSLSFSSLGSYKQLYLIWGGLYTSDNSGFDFRFNNDSGNNYDGNYWGLANTAAQNGYANGSSVGLSTFYSFIKYVTNASLFNRGRGYLILDNYTSTSKYKNYYGQVNFLEAEYTEKKSYAFSGVYASQSAITSLDIVRTAGSGTFSNATNTTIRLYGVS